jgi:transposase-like protein
MSGMDSPQGGDGLAEYVAELFLAHGLSVREISLRLGIGRRQVRAALADGDVPVPPRGAGRSRPGRRHPDPPDLEGRLRRLYCEERLTRAEIARRLGLTDGFVRSRLAEFGIQRRTRGRYNREDRQDVDAADLLVLYRDRALTADEVGAKLNVSRRVVLRAAHERGIPVRPGAAEPHAAAIELIDALYRDRLVADVLKRHDVPAVPAGGAIAERFPTPVPVTEGLVRELYEDCGVSIMHIELLTGQPTATVRRRLRDEGVAMRPPGGRCPFLRRWRQSHRRHHRGGHPAGGVEEGHGG